MCVVLALAFVFALRLLTRMFTCACVCVCVTRANQPLASTTATGMTTSQTKNLIGRMVKNKRAARAARTLE